MAGMDAVRNFESPLVAIAQVSAAAAIAVAGLTPAGGTGATAGAYDTAANRDILIATVAEMKVTVNALVTLANSNKAQINALLAELQSKGTLA